MDGKVILYSGWYTSELCQEHPNKFFVFGDNTKRIGMGGQAIIRREPNALGVATKRYPAMSELSFFSEDSSADMEFVLDDLAEVWEHLNDGATVVIPVTPEGKPTLGLERAELRKRAPSIYEAICRHVSEMVDAFGDPEIVDTL
ncbi:hypothetical protein [Erythrobacter phage vB_EliS-L02]|nr:hypothetical protein [Erythrobacter phage vB_EliS-L02]